MTQSPGGAMAGMSAFTEEILSTGEVLEIQPGTIEILIKASEELSRTMGSLAARARDELRVENMGLGEAYPNLRSAQQLAQKFNQKAVGGGGLEDVNTAVGQFEAHQAYADEVRDMLVKVLEAYTAQEAANTAALNSTGVDQ